MFSVTLIDIRPSHTKLICMYVDIETAFSSAKEALDTLLLEYPIRPTVVDTEYGFEAYQGKLRVAVIRIREMTQLNTA